MSRYQKRLSLGLCVLLLLAQALCPALAEGIPSKNPLLHPLESVPEVQTEHEYFNLLLLGIDFGDRGYRGSGGKNVFSDCHTDAVLVASLDKTEQRLRLISLPRDTLTYVPGVMGIYKLNAAINCADTTDEGLQRIQNAASWLLGGVKIDRYCAVDMNAMIEIGDLIGGVDLDVEMNYTGHSGTKYRKGLQHLDGTGITDYFRARTNATTNANDIGRTGRQRQLMTAIFQKLRSEPALLTKLLSYAQSTEQNVLTNFNLLDSASFLPLLLSGSADDVGSYVLTGPYRSVLQWNFTLTDQDNRIEVLKETFGIDAEPLPYVSREYTKWLEQSGFQASKAIRVGWLILKYAQSVSDSGTAEQQEALQTLEAALNAACAAFDQAADTMDAQDTSAMKTARKALIQAGDQAAEQFAYPEKYRWNASPYWYTDTMINQYQPKWQ